MQLLAYYTMILNALSTDTLQCNKVSCTVDVFELVKSIYRPFSNARLILQAPSTPYSATTTSVHLLDLNVVIRPVHVHVIS